ncbi:ATP-binding protein [Fodinisporobacter ferrooxydans]|uniref:ATP-binding protein n=2 Tax=Fodinisporobacter ferrooxydans TaxID=2901836 RepID=A0ABY4CJX8_9BACL|nr:ATP-binding protein [Alicyclobacillaceae bacterium MYW30-H2]
MNQSNSATIFCKKCNDEAGYLVKDDNDNDIWRMCDCVEQRRARRLMRTSELTDELRKLGFKNFLKDGRPACVMRAYETASNYYRQFDHVRYDRQNSIALLGVPGTGKTHLLVAACNNLLTKGISVLYFPHVEGFNNLKDNLDELETKIGYMKNVDVLYWDDLFKGRKTPTDFQLEQFFGVINYRYLNNKPIMVSSEKTVDQLMDIDQAIASRIYEMCKHFLVIMELTPEEKAAGMKLNYRLEG